MILSKHESKAGNKTRGTIFREISPRSEIAFAFIWAQIDESFSAESSNRVDANISRMLTTYGLINFESESIIFSNVRKAFSTTISLLQCNHLMVTEFQCILKVEIVIKKAVAIILKKLKN